MRQMSMFDEQQSAPLNRAKLIQIMYWVKEPDGDWIAKGRKGDFRLFKKGGRWKGRYCSYDERVFFYMCSCSSLSELKKHCEKNRYWEK